MGMTAEGVLYYGFPLRNSAERGESDEDESTLMDRAYKHEMETRARECPEPGEYDHKREKTDEAWGKTWQEWREKLKEWERRFCDVHRAGYADQEGAVYVCFNGSVKTAEWDEMVPISTEMLLIDTMECNKRLKDYCDALGIPWQTPDWYLTSYYG